MAGIDILDIKPTVISRDLKGKYILIYGKPKTGKTTLASKFPKNLLIAFEKGYNAIDGIKAVDINTWSDFKLVLRQLKKPEAQAMYDTITIDTTTIAYEMCEQYVCSQNGVQSIRDIPWGQGWTLTKKEFETSLRQITMLGYGLVLISHIETRKEKMADDSEIEILAPSMPKRCYEVVNQIVDIIGYIATEWNDNGDSERWLYTRQTPTVMAGSRFPYLSAKIKLGYDELVKAINEAIDKQRELDGATVVDKIEVEAREELDFEKIREEASVIWGNLVSQDPANRDKILKKVEMVFGRKIKLSEITEDQKDLFYLVLLDMRDMMKK
jgi:hypothetical protein